MYRKILSEIAIIGYSRHLRNSHFDSACDVSQHLYSPQRGSDINALHFESTSCLRDCIPKSISRTCRNATDSSTRLSRKAENRESLERFRCDIATIVDRGTVIISLFSRDFLGCFVRTRMCIVPQNAKISSSNRTLSESPRVPLRL